PQFRGSASSRTVGGRPPVDPAATASESRTSPSGAASADTYGSCPCVCGIGLTRIPDSVRLLDLVPYWLLCHLFPPPDLLADYSGEAKGRNVTTGEGRTGARVILHSVPDIVKPFLRSSQVPY